MYLSNFIAIICIVASHNTMLSHGVSFKRSGVSHHSCSKKEKIDSEMVRCEPRPQVVPIPRRIHEVFHPNSVVVNRCSGSCYNMRPCTAKTTTKRCFEVYNKVSKREEYREVEEDLDCQCCDMTKDMCNDKQKFDVDQCGCLCTNKREEKFCWNTDGQWDASNCVCMCGKEETCLSTETWSEKYCGCIPED